MGIEENLLEQIVRLSKIEKDLRLMRDDLSAYEQFIQRNIKQSHRIKELETLIRDEVIFLNETYDDLVTVKGLRAGLILNRREELKQKIEV